MNLWIKNTTQTRILAPVIQEAPRSIDQKYSDPQVSFFQIPRLNFMSFTSIISSVVKIPVIFFQMVKHCIWADHIHLRCPGNIGLIACFVQIFFPRKTKTIKYAGNWDPQSKQPLSYRIQKKILSNTFLTRNCKVLVYGTWKGMSKNIYPFFTASYDQSEIEEISKSPIGKQIKLIFVGSLTKSKQPILAVKTAQALKKKGFEVALNVYGDGVEFDRLKQYIADQKLSNSVYLHGNQPKSVIKQAFKEAHFLVFLSKSEGWPKVVAEAMFWGCIPLASKVSCVPEMLGNGRRGALVAYSVEEITTQIQNYLNDVKTYQRTKAEAIAWSQQITLNRFESEIEKLVN
jgi:glycosyltransferase involved in cell wall biosynthesis